MKYEKIDEVMPVCVKCDKRMPDNTYQFCPWCGRKLLPTTELPKKYKRRRANKGDGTVFFNKGKRKFIARLCGEDIGAFFTEKEAREALDDFKQINKSPSVSNDTVEDVYQKWHKKYESQVTKGAMSSLENAWRYFPENVKNAKMRDLNTLMLDSALIYARDHGRGTAIFAKIRLLASQLCEFGISNNYITLKYSDYMTTPKLLASYTPPEEKHKFTEKEMDVLWRHKTNDDVKIILIYSYTGFRPDELFKIKVENVKNGIIVGGSKTKAGTNRHVPINAKIQPFIDYFLSKNKTYLIQNEPGVATMPVDLNNWRKRHFYPTLIQYGILKDENDKHLSPKSGRKTAASKMDAANVPDKVIKRIMGHTDINTTDQHYIEKEDSELIDEMNKLQ